MELLVNTLVYLNLSFNEFRVRISTPKLLRRLFSSQMENQKSEGLRVWQLYFLKQSAVKILVTPKMKPTDTEIIEISQKTSVPTRR